MNKCNSQGGVAHILLITPSWVGEEFMLLKGFGKEPNTQQENVDHRQEISDDSGTGLDGKEGKPDRKNNPTEDHPKAKTLLVSKEIAQGIE